jgi:hypothetical protein
MAPPDSSQEGLNNSWAARAHQNDAAPKPQFQMDSSRPLRKGLTKKLHWVLKGDLEKRCTFCCLTPWPKIAENALLTQFFLLPGEAFSTIFLVEANHFCWRSVRMLEQSGSRTILAYTVLGQKVRNFKVTLPRELRFGMMSVGRFMLQQQCCIPVLFYFCAIYYSTSSLMGQNHEKHMGTATINLIMSKPKIMTVTK